MFRFLFNFWLRPLFGLFFGSVATVPADSVLDSIAPGGDGEPTEGGDGEPVEGGEGEPVEGEEGEGGQPQEGAQPQKAKGGVDKEVGDYLETLKKENPKLAGKVKGLIYAGINATKELSKLKADFPNGVADVLQLKQAFDENLGGLENLEELGQDVALYHQLDSMIEAKDPRVVDNLAELWPEAIPVLGPKIFEKLADVAPDTYNKIYAGMVISEINAQKLPQLISLLQGYLEPALEIIQEPNAKNFVQRALQGIGNMTKWIENLGKIASQEVKEIQANGKPAADNREAEFAAKEQELFAKDVRAEYSRYLADELNTQIAKVLTGKKATLNVEQRRTLASNVIQRLNAAMNADQSHKRTVERFERAKDANGLMKYLRSRVAAVLKGENGSQGLVAKQFGLIFPRAGLGGKKPDEKIDPKTGKPVVAAAPGSGWQQITRQEKDSLMSQKKIDWGKTTAAMRMKNRYVLVDGRQVWHQ